MGLKKWLRAAQPEPIVPLAARGARSPSLAATRADAVAGSVIAHYRSELFQIKEMLEAAEEKFDRCPHEYALTLAIRGYRARLGEGLVTYFAAAGSRSTRDILPVVQCAQRVDMRLSSLDEEMSAEVTRFETSAEAIARYLKPDASRDARILCVEEAICVEEANELLLEIGLYRTSWQRALQEKETNRLNLVESKLRSILDTAPATPSAPLLRLSRSAERGPEIAMVSSSSATNSSPSSSQSSSSDGTYASIIRPQTIYNGSHSHQQRRPPAPPTKSDPLADQYRTRQRRRRPRHGASTPASSTPSGSPPDSSSSNPPLSPASSHPSVTPPPPRASRQATAGTSRRKREDRVHAAENEQREGRGRDRELDNRGEPTKYPGSRADMRSRSPGERGGVDMHTSGGSLLVQSRSRTLRDMAAAASSMDADDNHSLESYATATAEAMYPDATYTEFAQAAAEDLPTRPRDDQPPLVPAKSFASLLYSTQNVRSEAMSDDGMVFQPFRVRGDGRCLFRSVARSSEVNRGRKNMNEREEREMADALRKASVLELKKHRELLAQFYVIETDFAKYAKRMSNPRTFGGEPELLVLAKILHAPIAVYILVNGRYKQIQVYGRQYSAEPCRILYSDGVHYDSLLTVKSRAGERR